MILDVHTHVGKPNYAYRAAEFTRADLVSRMKAGSVERRRVFSFYNDLIPFALINPKLPGAADQLEQLIYPQRL